MIELIFIFIISSFQNIVFFDLFNVIIGFIIFLVIELVLISVLVNFEIVVVLDRLVFLS